MIIENLLDDLGIIAKTGGQIEKDHNLRQSQEFMRYERNYQAALQPTLKNLQVTTSPDLDSLVLDDSGIMANTDSDSQIEKNHDLKQGQEFVQYEKNYQATQPTFKNLQVTTSPNLDSLVEGMTSTSDSTQPDSTQSTGAVQDPTKLLSRIHKAREDYDNAFNAYIKSTKDIKKSEKKNNTDYNTILVNKNNKLTVQVYDKNLKDYVDTIYSFEKNDPTVAPDICLSLAQDYNIKNGHWGKAKKIPPIIDLWNSICMDDKGNPISPDGLELPNPMGKSTKTTRDDITMCPLEHPIAYGEPQGERQKANSMCCDSGILDNKCTGGSSGIRNGGATVTNYKVKIDKDKTKEVKSWPGFAIAGIIPIGINKKYNGTYHIIWYKSKHNKCPNDFIYFSDVNPVNMTGRINTEPDNRDRWIPSEVKPKVSGCFYITPEEKISLANEIDTVLSQILIVPPIFSKKNIKDYEMNIVQLSEKGVTVDDPVGETTNNLLPTWINVNIPVPSLQGICRSQHGGFFGDNESKPIRDPANYIIPDPSNHGSKSKDIIGTIQNDLYNGGLCLNNCIEGCSPWNNFEIYGSDKEKTEPPNSNELYKTCSINTDCSSNKISAIEYTRNLVGELIKFRKELYGSGMINSTALNELEGNEWEGGHVGDRQVDGECDTGTVFTKGRNKNIDYPGCPPGDWCCKRKDSTEDNLKMETCQDMRDAYKIYTKDGSWKQGCDNKDNKIQDIWNDSECNTDPSSMHDWKGPNLESDLYGKGCKNLPDIVNEAEDAGALPSKDTGKGNNKLFSTKNVYPERVYINKYGYKHSLKDILEKPLDELKQKINNCKLHSFKKKPDNQLCIGDNGSFDSTTAPLIDSIDNPLSNCNDFIIPQYNVSSLDNVGIGSNGADLSGNSTTCNGGIEDVGSIIKGNDNKYYWLDARGYKTIIPVENNTDLLMMLTSDSNKDRCMGYFNVQTNDELSRKISKLNTIDITNIPDVINPNPDIDVSDLICSSYDRSKYIKVIEKAEYLKNLVEQLANIISTNKKKNKELDTNITTEEENVKNLITKVNKDMDKLDKIKQNETTNEGRMESTALIKDSTRFQYIAWIIVGVILLLYSIFGIHSANMSSPFHIIMLVVCVIIAFIILRRIYLSGII